MVEPSTVTGTAGQPPHSSEDTKEAVDNSRSSSQQVMVSLVWIICVLSAVVWICVIVHIVRGEDMQTTVQTNPPRPDSDKTRRPETPHGNATTSVCNTDDCRYMRWLIHVSLDWDKDPCQNFYEYVCSGIMGRYPSWFEQNKKGILGAIGQNVSLAIDRYLAHAVIPKVGQTGFQKAAALYQLCTGRRRTNDDREALAILLYRFNVRIFQDSDFQPLEVFIQLFLKVHLFLVFRFQLAVDPATRSYVLIFRRSDEFLGWKEKRSQLLKDNKYRDYVTEAISWFTQLSDTQVDQVINAETEVLSLSEVQHHGGEQKENMPLAQFGFWRSDSAFSAEWVHLLKRNSFGALPGKLIVTAERGNIELFHDLFGNSDKINITSLRTYISWTVLNQLLLTAGLTVNVTEDDCKRMVMNFFPYSALSAVMFPVVNETRIGHVKMMSSTISQEITKSFSAASWWDAETRDAALAKLSKLKTYYAYPPDMSDPQGVEAFYQKFPDMRDSFFSAYVEAAYIYGAYYPYLMTRRSAESFINEDTLSQTHRADTLYLAFSNALYLYAGIMYRPAYVYGSPPEVNYGGLGRLIAGGIMRGFDTNGRKVDGNGQPINWWTEESDRAYVQRENCAQESYKNAQRGVSVHSGTYVTDMMAERSVYNAYRKASETARVTMGDVGSLTSDQVFYVSWCLMFCGESFENGVGAGHRCNVPLINSERFADAFSCPIGSFMNPKEKCHFW